MEDIQKYPRLIRLLKTVTVDHSYCCDQFDLFVNMALRSDDLLASEIQSACEDDSVSWRRMLNNEIVGDVFDTDVEIEAREFASKYLLRPAKTFMARP